MKVRRSCGKAEEGPFPGEPLWGVLRWGMGAGTVVWVSGNSVSFKMPEPLYYIFILLSAFLAPLLHQKEGQ